jgi:hypothetical protein
MLPGSGKTFINSALVYAAEERRIACFAGLVAGISIVRPLSAEFMAGAWCGLNSVFRDRKDRTASATT